MNRLYKTLVWNFGRPAFMDDQQDNTIIQQTDRYLAELRARKNKLKHIVRVHKLVNKYFSLKDARAKKRIERQINAQQ